MQSKETKTRWIIQTQSHIKQKFMLITMMMMMMTHRPCRRGPATWRRLFYSALAWLQSRGHGCCGRACPSPAQTTASRRTLGVCMRRDCVCVCVCVMFLYRVLIKRLKLLTSRSFLLWKDTIACAHYCHDIKCTTVGSYDNWLLWIVLYPSYSRITTMPIWANEPSAFLVPAGRTTGLSVCCHQH